MRQLASALQRLGTTAGEVEHETSTANVHGSTSAASRRNAFANRFDAAVSADTADHGSPVASPFLRRDAVDTTLRPHIVATPQVVVPAARANPAESSSEKPTSGARPERGDRYRHEYQQIVAYMRDLSSSRRSTIVSLLGASESCTTAELTRDLAECLARQGEHPILLVDGNFWDRRLSLCCDAGSRTGLSDVIAGWSWRNVVVSVPRLNVSLVPAGSGFVQKPNGLSWSAVMDDWRDSFRWVLIDGGPSVMWLAEGLCKSSDEIILHSNLEQNYSPELELAVRRIRRLVGRLVGSIFTGENWRQAS